MSNQAEQLRRAHDASRDLATAAYESLSLARAGRDAEAQQRFAAVWDAFVASLNAMPGNGGVNLLLEVTRVMSFQLADRSALPASQAGVSVPDWLRQQAELGRALTVSDAETIEGLRRGGRRI